MIAHMKTTNQERKLEEERIEKELVALAVDIVLSDSAAAILTPDDVVKVVTEHKEKGEWIHPTGEARTVCTVHESLRRTRVLVMTEPGRTSTSLFIAQEIVLLLASYSEMLANDKGKQVPRAGRFSLGPVRITRGAMEAVSDEEVAIALFRHLAGDWGDVDRRDWNENDLSVGRSLRLLSSYRTEDEKKFWVITEADRSVTTVLLPEEY
jgi:hypothetical protein